MSDAATDHQNTVRAEAFSDGVFAIAITLLILEIKVPHAESQAALMAKLAEQWPSYFAFVTSFATIGIMWINHHSLFTLIRRVDHALLSWNLLLLMAASIVPFPTAMLADYMGRPGEKLAAAIYAASFVLVGLGYLGLLLHITSPSGRGLLRVRPDDPTLRRRLRNTWKGPIAYAIAAGLAFVHPGITLAMTFGLALFYARPHAPAEPT